MPVYLTLQPIRRAACAVADAAGGLLHHLFTLTPGVSFVTKPHRGRFFSVTLLSRCRLPVVSRYGALCCPDFPHAPHSWARDEPPVPCYVFLEVISRIRLTRLIRLIWCLCVTLDDAALAVAHEEDDLVALGRCRQLGLDAADGVGDVEAAEVEVAVDVLDVADTL